MNDSATQRWGKTMLVLAWCVILGILTWGFQRWLDTPTQVVIQEQGMSEVVLKRSRQGHYIASGFINRQPVRFLIDTGASQVSIPAHFAERLNLQPGVPTQAVTANGVITVYSTIADEIALGPIVLTKVRADLNPYLTGEEVLLGMSFIRHLEWIQRDGVLTLRHYQ